MEAVFTGVKVKMGEMDIETTKQKMESRNRDQSFVTLGLQNVNRRN